MLQYIDDRWGDVSIIDDQSVRNVSSQSSVTKVSGNVFIHFSFKVSGEDSTVGDCRRWRLDMKGVSGACRRLEPWGLHSPAR